jgi:hypothetical protein
LFSFVGPKRLPLILPSSGDDTTAPSSISSVPTNFSTSSGKSKDTFSTMGNLVQKDWKGSSIAMSTYGHSISGLLKEDGIIMRMGVRSLLLEEEVLATESGLRSVMLVVAEIGIFTEGLLNPWPKNGYEKIVKDSLLRRS